jgi:hypothetical protein
MNDSEIFGEAMRKLYLDAKDAGYNATYFLRMLNDFGGVTTARRLLASSQPSEGFTRLWEMGRLDLSVEALILHDRWRRLFSTEERTAARERLANYGWAAAI